MRDRIGKCTTCKHVMTWPARMRIKLSDAFCSRCGKALKQTTHASQWPRCIAGPVGFTDAAKLRARASS